MTVTVVFSDVANLRFERGGIYMSTTDGSEIYINPGLAVKLTAGEDEHEQSDDKRQPTIDD